MRCFPTCSLVGVSMLAACAAQGTPASADPNAGNYDNYYSEKAGGAKGSGNEATGDTPVPKPKTVSSTRGAPPRKGKITAKKPPVDGGTKPRPSRVPANPQEAMVFAGFVPTNAGAGSLVEVYGSGFGRNPGDTLVTIGGKPQQVVEVGADRLVVKVKAGAEGALGLVRMARVGKQLQPVKSVKSEAVFHSIPAKSNFGKPRTDAGHGLVANVYAIASPGKELPAFDTLGDPIGTYAVDNLDIPSAKFVDGFAGADGKRKEWFGLHFRGSLNVTEAGSYEFCLASGDGAQLYLDENLIVDNDGVHDTKETCETVTVDPGEFQFDLLYFQAAAGEAGLQLFWAKDGGDKVVIPKESLFPPEDMTALVRK